MSGIKGLSRKKHTTEHRPNQQHNPKDSKSIQNISKTSQNIQKPYPRLIWSTKPQSPGLPRHRISHHPDEEMAWRHGMGWSFQHVESWCKICLDSEQKNTQHQLKIYSKSHWRTRKSLGCGVMFVKHCPRVESEKNTWTTATSHAISTSAAEFFGRSRQVEAMTVHVGLSKSDFGKDHILAAVHRSQISPNQSAEIRNILQDSCPGTHRCTLTALNLLLRDDSHDLPRIAGTHGSIHAMIWEQGSKAEKQGWYPLMDF